MRVAVIGAGIMGAASAWALARDGHEVTVLEQFELDHGRGSSHGASRIFRLAYTQPEWVALAREALPAWRELEAEAGQTLLELDGLVECVPGLDHSSAAALDSCGVAWEEIEPERVGVAVPDGWTGLLQPEAGIVRADRARAAFLRGIPVERRRVERLDDVDADAVVVAAGPWAPKLLADHGIELRAVPMRETVVYFRNMLRVGAVVDRETDRHLVYAVRDPVHGVKAGVHMSGPEADPDEPGEPDERIVERVAAWIGERFPGADTQPVATDTCFYTTRADESFVVERHGRVVVCSACSGHGFKFAPAIGRRVAGLVTAGYGLRAR